MAPRNGKMLTAVYLMANCCKPSGAPAEYCPLLLCANPGANPGATSPEPYGGWVEGFACIANKRSSSPNIKDNERQASSTILEIHSNRSTVAANNRHCPVEAQRDRLATNSWNVPSNGAIPMHHDEKALSMFVVRVAFAGTTWVTARLVAKVVPSDDVDSVYQHRFRSARVAVDTSRLSPSGPSSAAAKCKSLRCPNACSFCWVAGAREAGRWQNGAPVYKRRPQVGGLIRHKTLHESSYITGIICVADGNT